MRIVLGVPMRNEVVYGPHVEWQLKNALSMEYDDIVILDDGSDDGTWEVLQDYDASHKRIHAFRNKKNSILNPRGTNRWATLVGHMAKFNPTWVNIRAADQVYSKYYTDNLRGVLRHYLEKDLHIVRFPLVHLWRSESWYRLDRLWGNDSWGQTRVHVWRFSPKYKYGPKQSGAILHQGRHFPGNLGFNERNRGTGANNMLGPENYGREKNKPWPIVVLHHGHTTHEKKEAKFRLSMEAAKSGFAYMAGPGGMPPVAGWIKHNGYKGFYEFGINLAPAPAIWFGEDYKVGPKPQIKSFFKVINEYNPQRAKEYQTLFNKHFGEE